MTRESLGKVYLDNVFQILREEEHGTPAASVAGVYSFLGPKIFVPIRHCEALKAPWQFSFDKDWIASLHSQ